MQTKSSKKYFDFGSFFKQHGKNNIGLIVLQKIISLCFEVYGFCLLFSNLDLKTVYVIRHFNVNLT